MKGRSWRTDCPLVLAACHKFGQGDHVRSLHEFSKSAHVLKLELVIIEFSESAHVLKLELVIIEF